ncbi:MAG TPA: arginase [Azospirillaceae bacterium]|nr:arginase [Azospirillaceae bacterium]
MTRFGRAAPWFGIVGAPSEVGNVGCGAAGGPAALREGGLAARLEAAGAVVRDRGDAVGPAYDGRVEDGVCRSVAATASWSLAVRDACADVLADGGVPLMVGGDHSLALGSVAAASRHARQRGVPLYVLWFDAHPDFNTPETSPSGNTHGLPAAAACGIGHPAMLDLGGGARLLDPSRLFQFGIRSIDEGEAENLRRHRVTFHTMEAVRREGLAALVGRALEEAARHGGHVHVSFDVDGLDPAVAPGVGTPVPDGLGLEETLEAMDLLGRSGLVGSFDLVEFAPRHDRGGATLEAALALLGRFAAASSRAAGLRAAEVA